MIEEKLESLIELYTLEIEDDTECLKKYKDELENVLKESDCLSEVDNSRICSLHKIVERKANQIRKEQTKEDITLVMNHGIVVLLL